MDRTRRLVLAMTFTLNIGFFASNVFATIYMDIGIASNIVARAGKVYFAQGDDSLTVLDLATGKVLARRTGHDYTGQLIAHDQGLVVIGCDIAVLDWETLAIRWQSKGHWDAQLDGDYIITGSG